MSIHRLVALLFLLILIMVNFFLGIVLNYYAYWYCPTPLAVTDVGTMKKYKKASLYPYNGNWSKSLTDLTEAGCIDTCIADPDCKGFFRHATPATCYFYTATGTAAMLGSQVVVDPAFTSTDTFVIGRQQPSYSSDVYLKSGVAYKALASIYDQPVVLLTENCA